MRQNNVPEITNILRVFLLIYPILFCRRYRNRKSTSNNYEDAHFTTSANENIYTCLDSTSQSALSNNNACASFRDGACDQNSIHEYHSVHFSTQGSLYETINSSNQKSDYMKPPPPRKIWTISFLFLDITDIITSLVKKRLAVGKNNVPVMGKSH